MDIVTQAILAGAAIIMTSLVGWLVIEANSVGKSLVAIRKDIEHILKQIPKVDTLESIQNEHAHKIVDLEVHCLTGSKRIKGVERFLTKTHGEEFAGFYEKFQDSVS
jgi:hypothetical protein